MKPISIAEKFDLFTARWTPHIVAELNGQQVKLARLEGEFIWHSHAGEDELFWVVSGVLYMDFRDRTEVVRSGELIVVPRGIEHRPRTEPGREVQVLLFEPATTRHTGEVESERTVKQHPKI